MKNADILLKVNASAIVTFFIGLFFFLSIPSQIEVYQNDGSSGVNSRTMPYLIASAIILISLYMIVSNSLSNGKVNLLEPNDDSQEATRYGRIFLAFVAVALWIVVIPYLGFNLSMMLLVTAIMMIIGNCRWWHIAIIALALSFPINHLLAAVLKVYLPSGSLFG